RIACRLVAPEALPEVALHNEPAAHQDFEGAIHGGRRDHDPEDGELALDVVGRQVSLAAEYDARDGLALGGDGEVAIAQIGAKGLHYIAAAHGRSDRTTRRASGVMSSGSPSSPARRCTPRTTSLTAGSGASASAVMSTSHRPRSGPLRVHR